MHYSKFRLPGAILAGLLCIGCLVVAAVFPGRYPWVAWTTAGLALASLLAVGVLSLRPRLGGALFAVAGLSGAAFKSASGFHMPTELAAWAWVLVALALATMGLVEHADDRAGPSVDP